MVRSQVDTPPLTATTTSGSASNTHCTAPVACARISSISSIGRPVTPGSSAGGCGMTAAATIATLSTVVVPAESVGRLVPCRPGRCRARQCMRRIHVAARSGNGDESEVAVNGPVLGAIITSGVALVVAIVGGLRRTRQAFVQRRYEKRQEFLVEAQDAMLALRDALATYGVALQDQLRGDADPAAGTPGVLVTGASAVASSFVLAVPQAVSLQVAAARGRLAVARSRLDDDAVVAALREWETLAQASMIDPHDTQTSAEESAFDAVNDLIHAALQSSTGKAG